MENRLSQLVRKPKMQLLIDFDKVGIANMNNWFDATDYLLSITGSKERSTEIVGGLSSDIATFEVDNSTNIFSTSNRQSPLYGKLKPNLLYVLKAGFEGEVLQDYIMGYTTKFSPTWKDRKYQIQTQDFFYKLKKEDVPKEGYQNISWKEAVNILLDVAGIPEEVRRSIPNLKINFSYLKFEEAKCFEALNRILEVGVAEAYFEGLDFIVKSKIDDDYVLDLNPKHTFEESNMYEFDETVEDEAIINKVQITSEPKVIGLKEVVFETPENVMQVQDEIITSDGGNSFYIDTKNLPIINNDENPISIKNLTEGRVIHILNIDQNTGLINIHPESLEYIHTGDQLSVSYAYQQLAILPDKERQFVLNLSGEVQAISDIDIAVWDSKGDQQLVVSQTPDTDNTVSMQSYTYDEENNRVKVTLKNNYAEAITISTLQLRGYPIKTGSTIEVNSRNQPSIDEFGVTEQTYTNNYFTNAKLVQKIAQFITDNYGKLRKNISIEVDGYAEILINDVAKVIEKKSGTEHLFYVQRIDYSHGENAGWNAKLNLVEMDSEKWSYEGFEGDSVESIEQGEPEINIDFDLEINANLVRNGGAELHTGTSDYADAGALDGKHYVPDYWQFTRVTGDTAARVRQGGGSALHARQSFEMTTSNGGKGFFSQTVEGIAPGSPYSASFLARAIDCTGLLNVHQYEGTTLLSTLQFDIATGYTDNEFNWTSHERATSFIIEVHKKSQSTSTETFVFDRMKIENAEEASKYVETEETQSVQVGQKYANSTTIGNDKGIIVYDENDNERVVLGQYAPSKYGLQIQNGSIEIVGGLTYDNINSDVGKQIDISENNALTVIAQDVSTLGSTVSGHTSAIQANATEIGLRVRTDTYENDIEGIEGRLSSTEGSLTVMDNAIKQKVEQQTYDTDMEGIETTLSTHTGQITTMAEQIDLRVTSETYTTDKAAMESRIQKNEASITTISESITLLVTEETYTTDMNGVKQRISATEGSITTLADEINLRVKTEDYTTDKETNEQRFQKNEGNITTLSNQISLRVTKDEIKNSSPSNLLHGTAFKDEEHYTNYWNVSVASTVDTTKKFEGFNSLKLSATGNTSDKYWTNYSEFVNIVEGEKITVSTYSYTENLAGIDGTYNIGVGFYDATDTRFANEYISIKPSKNNVWERISSTVTAPAGTVKIQLRFYLARNGTAWFAKPMLQKGSVLTAHTLHVDEMATELKSRVSSAESNITTLSNSISLMVKEEDYTVDINGVKERLSSAEGSITTMAGEIELRVKTEDYTGETMVSKINLLPDSVKISAKNVDLEGVVSFSDLSTAGQTTIVGDNITGGTITLGGATGGSVIMVDANGETVMTLSASQKGFDNLNVDNFYSPKVLEYGNEDIKLYVSNIKQTGYPPELEPDDSNVGDGWGRPLRTISEALRRIPRNYDGNAIIYLPYNGSFAEYVTVEGFTGTGSITFVCGNENYQAEISGKISVDDTTIPVTVERLKLFAGDSVGAGDGAIMVTRSTHVMVKNCSIQGNSATSYGVAGRYNSFVEVEGCDIFDTNRGLGSLWGSKVINRNNRGTVRVSGAYAYSGDVLLQGTMVWGANFETDQFFGGRVLLSGEEVKNADKGTGTPSTPPPATKDIVKSWKSTGGTSWRPSYGWLGQPAQGKWGVYGIYKGLWYFPSTMSSTVTGKTIKKVRIFVTRQSGAGNGGYVPLYFRTHNYTAQPSGEPTVSTIWYRADLKPGEGRWVTLSNDFCTALQNGAKGIGLYYGSSSKDYYAKMLIDAYIEVTYQ